MPSALHAREASRRRTTARRARGLRDVRGHGPHRQPLSPWRRRQLDGIEWLAAHERRARLRMWSLIAGATAVSYAGATVAAYTVIR